MNDVRTVSVLLTTRNRAPILARTLERFTELGTPDFEARFVVGDNGSSDETGRVLTEAATRLPLRAINEPTPGKNRALNRALELVEGELVVFTDDDVLPDRDWLEALVSAARRIEDADVFGGRVLLAPPPGAPDAIFESEEWAVNFARYHPREAEGFTDRTPYGPNFAVRPAVLERHTFDEEIGPDGTGAYTMGSETDFLLRAQETGHRFYYVPGARVRHIVRPEQLEVGALSARSYRIGRGWGRMQEADAPVPTLDGAPRWIWRQWLGAKARRTWAELTPGAPPLDVVLRERRLAGMVDELRRSGPG